MSSFWALGWTGYSCGLLSLTQTLKNLEKRWDCVINLPTSETWKQEERLAPLTGQNRVPLEKRSQFRYDPDRFAAGEFTPIASEIVAAGRVKDCPVHLEAVLSRVHMLDGDVRLAKPGGGAAVEVEVVRVHVRKDLVIKENYIAAEKWQPVIYNFRHYFGLGAELGKTFRADV